MAILRNTVLVVLAVLVQSSWSYCDGLKEKENQPVQVLHKEKPHYSRSSQMLGIEGTVRLLVPVYSNGEPGIPIVISSGPYTTHPRHFFRGLEKSSIRAVRQCRFSPAIESGVEIDSEIEMEYHFVCDRDSTGAPKVRTPNLTPPRSQTIKVSAAQVCLYGHWLQKGEVEVQQIENRVFVGGIRVYPCFNSRENFGRLDEIGLFDEIKKECDWLQRDLFCLGKGPEIIESELYRLLASFPAKFDFYLKSQGVFEIKIAGLKWEYQIWSELPGYFSEFRAEPRLVMAEDQYYGWQGWLESGNTILFTQFSETGLARDSAAAIAVEEHLLKPRRAGSSPFGKELPKELLGKPILIKNALLNPEWVFRQ